MDNNNDESCEPDVEMDQNNDGLSNMCVPHTFFDRMVNGPISESQAASLMRNLLEAIE
ncbi:hypothetical protein JHK82_055768 [Glycine max]|nr:hypothetical protein JHK82_055768 [Glycine max]